MPDLFESEEALCHSEATHGKPYASWSVICQEINEATIYADLEENEIRLKAKQQTELTQYILAHAKILFALLNQTGDFPRIRMLVESKLTDDYLPIVWDQRQGRAKSLGGASKDDKALEWFKPILSIQNQNQHKIWIKNFCNTQWKFLAPVFTDCEIVYPLHTSCSLPFPVYEEESGEGAYSSLYKGEIHASHWKTIRRQPDNTTKTATSSSHVPVAIKKITKQHEATDKWVQVEVAALELVRSLHHPHLISFLTSYRMAGCHYLIFNWANGGNLGQFWKKNAPYHLPEQARAAPLSHRESIIWAIDQMAGLAAGLDKLHRDDEHGVHCRHGDLKPANIVRSTSINDSKSKSHGHLLITDMGVANVNDKATYMGWSSGDVKATIRYQSPEFLYRLSPDSPTSRAYDIWSMGCTVLEFIIWLLYGPTQLDVFNDLFPSTTFFSSNTAKGILNSAVQHWVKHMQRGPLSEDENDCVSAALREILNFILKRVLIQDVRPELEDQSVVSDESTKNPQVFDLVVNAPEIQTSIPSNKQRRRANSKELYELLEAVRAKKGELSYILREPPSGKDHILEPPRKGKSTVVSPPFEGSVVPPPATRLLRVPQGNAQETGNINILSWEQLQPVYADLPHGKADPNQPYVTEYLRDSWDPIPDNELALELFPEIISTDVLPGSTISSNTASPPTYIRGLCGKCLHDSSGVLSLRFVCEATVESLEEKKMECGVCWMLLQHALRTGSPLQREMKFLRSGSYLMRSFDEKGRPDERIFSLVVGPGITAAPNDLQRSFPKLPQVATEVGREAGHITPRPRPKLTVTGEEARFVIMKKWIADCDEKHTVQNKNQPNCNPERLNMRLPTRLIHVGHGECTNIYLDCRETREPGLKYIALSHRWCYPPDDEEWKPPFWTTDGNINTFKDPNQGIDFAAMPKTFRDAIEVTRGLGLKYLWIDSLCIIQNQSDNADFKNECHRMRDVYNGAYCTIASTGANGTTDGFLNKREDRACVRIDTTRKLLDGKTPDSTDDKSCTIYICDAIDNFGEDVDKADMATRGWIFQERALSRRTLHFAKNQVYWECGAGVCCETMMRLFNRKATFMSDPDFPRQASDYNKGMKIRFYETLYKHYSGLNFSYDPNRAVAMSGLEDKMFATFHTKGAYGIMDGEFLHRTLLWQRKEKLPNGAMTRISFKENDPAPPSWSWMAVSGVITYLQVDFGTIDWDRENIRSPFRNEDGTTPGVTTTKLVPIEVVPRNIKLDVLRPNAKNLIFDRAQSPMAIPGLKCVVMGTKKDVKKPRIGGDLDTTFLFPVLLIGLKAFPDGTFDPKVYERVGVGKLEEHEMGNQPAEKQWLYVY